jgi:hypothetical protein
MSGPTLSAYTPQLYRCRLNGIFVCIKVVSAKHVRGHIGYWENIKRYYSNGYISKLHSCIYKLRQLLPVSAWTLCMTFSVSETAICFSFYWNRRRATGTFGYCIVAVFAPDSCRNSRQLLHKIASTGGDFRENEKQIAAGQTDNYMHKARAQTR